MVNRLKNLKKVPIHSYLVKKWKSDTH